MKTYVLLALLSYSTILFSMNQENSPEHVSAILKKFIQTASPESVIIAFGQLDRATAALSIKRLPNNESLLYVARERTQICLDFMTNKFIKWQKSTELFNKHHTSTEAALAVTNSYAEYVSAGATFQNALTIQKFLEYVAQEK